MCVNYYLSTFLNAGQETHSAHNHEIFHYFLIYFRRNTHLSKKMKLSIFCLILSLYIFYTKASCPSNCRCVNGQGMCIITSCTDLFPNEELFALEIRGFLCQKQRMQLANNFRMRILMMNDYCGYIGNCR